MQFVNPGFLWAMLAVSIPILIHLFNFRRFKRVMFTNISLLKNIQIETKNRQRVKNLLILIARCLAIIFLVMAFAQPFIPASNQNTDNRRRAVSVYIDNSYSMNATGSSGDLLQTAKNRARELVKSMRETDRFQILSNDFTGKGQHLLGKDEALLAIDEVKLSPISRYMSAVMERQKEALTRASGMRKMAVLISDFQRSTSDISALKPDSNIQTLMVPLKANETQNVAIDSCWFETPFIQLNGANKLMVAIKNYGEQNIENGSISLKLNGKQKAVSGFNCGKHASATAVLSFTLDQAGWQSGELAIVDNPITFDDKFYIAFESAKSYHILCVNGATESLFINNVYATEPICSLTNLPEGRIDYQLLSKSDLVILNGCNDMSSGTIDELNKYLNKGGDMMVFPSTKGVDKLNNLLSGYQLKYAEKPSDIRTEVDQLNEKSNLFDGVYEKKSQQDELPLVKKFYTIEAGNSSGFEPVMKLKNGGWFAIQAKAGKGKIIMLASPLLPDWCGLAQSPYFIPMMLKAAFISKPVGNLFNRIGGNGLVPLGVEVLKTEKGVKLSKDKLELVPELLNRNGETFLYTADMMKEAGNYILAAGNTNPAIAYNYNNLESDMSCFETVDIEKQISNTGIKLIGNSDQKLNDGLSQLALGTQLWKTFVWLALLMVLLEIALIKFLK